MGIFNDNRRPLRDDFQYSYTGEELRPFALAKYRLHTKVEMEARERMSSLLRDSTIRTTDKEMEDLKTKIALAGAEREKCAIWVHEFTRHPEVEYRLSLSDVSYFDIAVYNIPE